MALGRDRQNRSVGTVLLLGYVIEEQARFSLVMCCDEMSSGHKYFTKTGLVPLEWFRCLLG
jgi:hypothetical protein